MLFRSTDNAYGFELQLPQNIIEAWQLKNGEYFFFQAEDGIRGKLVTGVQTCALPIYLVLKGFESGRMKTGTPPRVDGRSLDYSKMEEQPRSEERRVGKE